MGRGLDKLTDAEIRGAIKAAAASGAARKLWDGGGMYLHIKPPRAAYWRLKYRVAGVEKLISLGVYDEVSLKTARKRREAARALVGDHVDPSEKRKAAKAARRTAAENTFEAVAREWYAKKSPAWAKSNATRVLGRLKVDAFPKLGAQPIASLTSARLLEVLRIVEERGAVESSHRIRQYMNSIFQYAIQTHRLQANPVPHPGALATPVKGKFASITDATGVGALIRAIRGYTGSPSTQVALQLAPLVFVRPGELRTAEWSEFDLDAAEWRIPADKMKMRSPHFVPLSTQAVALLERLKPITSASKYLFHSERSKHRPMSANTLNAALRALGYTTDQMTTHGFRHMASTLLNESGKWKPDAIERQLAHMDHDSIRAIYNAAEHLPERRLMMQWWADRLDTLAATKNVQNIGEARKRA
jgi:integrase